MSGQGAKQGSSWTEGKKMNSFDPPLLLPGQNQASANILNRADALEEYGDAGDWWIAGQIDNNDLPTKLLRIGCRQAIQRVVTCSEVPDFEYTYNCTVLVF